MDAQTIAMIAKPVLAAVGTLLGTFGVTGIMTGDAQINAAATLIGAVAVAASAIWAALHSRAITAQKHRIAAAGIAQGAANPALANNQFAAASQARSIVAATK
ncbi:MAG: hypothetical protein KGL39_07505 [Patescibacteria group bacterium]|nr:hypothetical protein [Patescibacteria group bacterium]